MWKGHSNYVRLKTQTTGSIKAGNAIQISPLAEKKTPYRIIVQIIESTSYVYRVTLSLWNVFSSIAVDVPHKFQN